MKAAGFLMTLLLATTFGCSTQYRSSDPQVSSDELMQLLSEATASAQAQSQGGVDATSFATDANTTIYFSMAEPGFDTMGNVASVMAFDNINFIDASVDPESLSGARVFFLDNDNGGTHTSVLIVGIQTDGKTYQYYRFDGTSSMDSGRFVFNFTGNDQVNYWLASYDVDGDSLSHDIQLKLYTSDPGGGDDIYVGKFSILAGFK